MKFWGSGIEGAGGTVGDGNLGLLQMNRRAWRLALLGLWVSVSVVALAAAQGLRPAQGLPGRRPHPGGGDRLVLRSGETRTGSLTGCGGSACLFNGSAVPRDEIEWIGLSGAFPPMPQVDNPGIDTIFLAGGDVKHETFETVNANTVLTDRGSYPRGNVRWIHLASSGTQGGGTPTPSVSGTPVIEGGEVTPVPTGVGSPVPTVPPTRPPTRPPTPKNPTPPTGRSPAPGHNVPGHLWSGMIHIHYRSNYSNGVAPGYTDVKTDIAAHLREYTTPLKRLDTFKVYGAFSWLEPEGTEMRTHFESDQQSQLGGNHCDGKGTLTLTHGPDTPGYSHASALYINRSQADTTPWIGFPIVPGTPRYMIGIDGRSDDHFTVNCTSWNWVGTMENGHREEQSYTQDGTFYTAVIGKNPVAGCPAFLVHVCDPEIRTIVGENGRMFGSFHNSWEQDDFHNDLEVRWSLCRDDVPCAESPPEPEKTPCPPTTEAQGWVDKNRDEYNAKATQIAELWKTYQQEMAEAKTHLKDFENTMRVCNVQNWISKVLIALLAPEEEAIAAAEEAAAAGGSAALNAEQEAALIQKGLNTVAEFIDKLERGENPWTALAPEDVKNALNALDAAKQFMSAMEGSSVDQLGESLEECAGTAGITQDQYTSAEEYVSGLKKAVEGLADVQTLVNDCKQLDNQLPDLQYKLYQACLENARCNHTPESDCDSLKPPGDWVPPP
jgi:hypothetical protein